MILHIHPKMRKIFILSCTKLDLLQKVFQNIFYLFKIFLHFFILFYFFKTEWCLSLNENELSEGAVLIGKYDGGKAIGKNKK